MVHYLAQFLYFIQPGHIKVYFLLYHFPACFIFIPCTAFSIFTRSITGIIYFLLYCRSLFLNMVEAIVVQFLFYAAHKLQYNTSVYRL